MLLSLTCPEEAELLRLAMEYLPHEVLRTWRDVRAASRTSNS